MYDYLFFYYIILNVLFFIYFYVKYGFVDFLNFKSSELLTVIFPVLSINQIQIHFNVRKNLVL